MDSAVRYAARATARRLAPHYGAELKAQVEAALRASEGGESPDQFTLDPVALGSLIVSAASLAWTVYTDLRSRAPKPPGEENARREPPSGEIVQKVRDDHPPVSQVQPDEWAKIIEILVEEINEYNEE